MRENETVVTAEKMTTDRRIEFELTNVDNLKIQVASFLKNWQQTDYQNANNNRQVLNTFVLLIAVKWSNFNPSRKCSRYAGFCIIKKNVL